MSSTTATGPCYFCKKPDSPQFKDMIFCGRPWYLCPECIAEDERERIASSSASALAKYSAVVGSVPTYSTDLETSGPCFDCEKAGSPLIRTLALMGITRYRCHNCAAPGKVPVVVPQLPYATMDKRFEPSDEEAQVGATLFYVPLPVRYARRGSAADIPSPDTVLNETILAVASVGQPYYLRTIEDAKNLPPLELPLTLDSLDSEYWMRTETFRFALVSQKQLMEVDEDKRDAEWEHAVGLSETVLKQESMRIWCSTMEYGKDKPRKLADGTSSSARAAAPQ